MEGDKAGYGRGKRARGWRVELEPQDTRPPGRLPCRALCSAPQTPVGLTGPRHGALLQEHSSHEGPAGARWLQDQDLPPPTPPSALGPRGDCKALTCHPTLLLQQVTGCFPLKRNHVQARSPHLSPRCSKERPLWSTPVGPRACAFSLHPVRDATDWAAYKQRTFIPRSSGGRSPGRAPAGPGSQTSSSPCPHRAEGVRGSLGSPYEGASPIHGTPCSPPPRLPKAHL